MPGNGLPGVVFFRIATKERIGTYVTEIELFIDHAEYFYLSACE